MSVPPLLRDHWSPDSEIRNIITSFPVDYRLKSKSLKAAKRISPSRSGTKLFSHPCIYLVLQLQTSTFLQSSLLCTSMYSLNNSLCLDCRFPFSPRERLPFKNQPLCHPLYQHSQLPSPVFLGTLLSRLSVL